MSDDKDIEQLRAIAAAADAVRRCERAWALKRCAHVDVLQATDTLNRLLAERFGPLPRLERL